MANETYDVSTAPLVAPVNLYIAAEPYPHLRDDGGCILARDYVDDRKMAFILAAVQEKLDRER